MFKIAIGAILLTGLSIGARAETAWDKGATKLELSSLALKQFVLQNDAQESKKLNNLQVRAIASPQGFLISAMPLGSSGSLKQICEPTIARLRSFGGEKTPAESAGYLYAEPIRDALGQSISSISTEEIIGMIRLQCWTVDTPKQDIISCTSPLGKDDLKCDK
jgi:hypothetical protein